VNERNVKKLETIPSLNDDALIESETMYQKQKELLSKKSNISDVEKKMIQEIDEQDEFKDH
jgi:hypothetical protein